MNDMNLSPERDLLLVKVDPTPEQTKSGFYIKEEWKSKPQYATVVAIGPKVTDIAVGDRVLFERYASTILDDDYRICQQSHILAKVLS